jgi:hypothetical protein
MCFRDSRARNYIKRLMNITAITFVFAFVATLWVSVALTRYAGISWRRFSIPSLLIVVYVIVAYIGILPLYFGLDESRLALGVVDRSIIARMLEYSAVTLLLIVGGYVFSCQCLRLKCEAVGVRGLQPTQFAERLVFILVLIVSIGVLLLYLKMVSSIAVLSAVHGQLKAAAVARMQMSTTFSGKYWRYHIFFGPMLQLCSVFFFADYRVSRKFASGLLFIGAFAVAAFASLMTLEKGPFVELLFALYLTYAITRGGNYWQPAAKYLAIVVIVGLAAMYMVFMGVGSLGEGLSQAAFRIFTGQITPAYFYLQIFPRVHEYLYGASFPNPGGVLPFTSFDLAKYVSGYMYPIETRMGLVGTAPTAFWGEMYADFGVLGVLIAPFPVGVVIYGVHYLFSKCVPTATTVAASVLVATHFATLARTSVSGYLVDTTSFAVVTVTVLALGARRARKWRGQGPVARQLRRSWES